MASELLIRLGLDDKRFYGALSSAERRIQRFGNKLESLGTELSTRVSLPLVGIGTAAVTAFAQFEKLENGLAAIAGGADEAGKQMERLRVIAQNPGINLEAAVQGSIRLQSVGFEAAQAEESLLAFSKAVTASGGTADDLNEVIRQLAQINSSGRITREDFGVIQDRITGVGLALETAFGTTNIEAIRETGISASEFTARLVQGINATEQFQNVQGGLANSFDNFRQSIRQSLVTLGRSIAESINLEKVLGRLAAFVQRVTEGFNNLSPAVQKAIVVAAGLLAAIGPLAIAGGALIKSILALKVAFTVLTGPIGIVITAVGAAVAAFVTFYQRSERFRATINGIGASLKAFALSIFDGLKSLIAPFGKILEGDIRGAVVAIGEAVERGNPIALFRNAGRAASDAYWDAFNTTTTEANRAQNIAEEALPDVAAAATPSSFGSFGAFTPAEVSGGGGAAEATPALLPPIIAPEQVEIIETLPDKVRGLSAALAEPITAIAEVTQPVNDNFARLREELEAGRQAASAFGNTFNRVAGSSVKGFRDIAGAAVQASAQVVRAKIQEAIAAYIADSFGKLGIFGAILAAGAGAVVGGIFSAAISRIKIPALADGGLVTKPTLALIGEAGPELVTPLDRVGDVMGGRQSGEFVVRGSDLVLVLERAKGEGARIRGF